VGGHRTPPAPVAPTTYGTIVGYQGADGYCEPQVELYDKSARLNGPRMMVSYAYEGDRVGILRRFDGTLLMHTPTGLES
jgi:hypothetical protein